MGSLRIDLVRRQCYRPKHQTLAAAGHAAHIKHLTLVEGFRQDCGAPVSLSRDAGLSLVQDLISINLYVECRRYSFRHRSRPIALTGSHGQATPHDDQELTLVTLGQLFCLAVFGECAD
jgi:hypothetical protein